MKTATAVDPPQRRAVRIAGIMFLLSFIIPTLNWVLGLSKLVVAESAIATGENIVANELVFRFGMAIELMMAAGLVVLAVALYSILEAVDRELALLALVLKVVEAAMVAAVVLVSLVALLMANDPSSLAAFTPEQLLAPAGLLLSTHTVVYAIPMVFLGLDMTLFFYLFFKSGYIPKPLAGFGVVSFLLILVHALGYVVAPDVASTQIAQVICYTPSGLLELAMGAWLLSKGIPPQLQGVQVAEDAGGR